MAAKKGLGSNSAGLAWIGKNKKQAKSPRVVEAKEATISFNIQLPVELRKKLKSEYPSLDFATLNKYVITLLREARKARGLK